MFHVLRIQRASSRRLIHTIETILTRNILHLCEDNIVEQNIHDKRIKENREYYVEQRRVAEKQEKLKNQMEYEFIRARMGNAIEFNGK